MHKNELKALPTIARIESEVAEFVTLLDACVQAAPGLDADERERLARAVEDLRSAAAGAVRVFSKDASP